MSVPETDDKGRPFNLDKYFQDLGLTKTEQKSKDPFEVVRKKIREGAVPLSEHNLFDVQPADDWMTRPGDPQRTARRLFGDFWLEGELAILFADTGMGKSILAVQIAESIARGRPIDHFQLDAPAAAEPVFEFDRPTILYLDFELTTDQFNRRYSGIATGDGGRYGRRRFHRDFLRAEPMVDKPIPPAFPNLGRLISFSIDNSVREYAPKFLIVDNLTWLSTANSPAAAFDLMQYLNKLKNRQKISILVLAHTPKRRFSRPLEVNDLAGSKILANLSDTMFAIGDSVKGPNIRYLKQIKLRSTGAVYGADNVAVAHIEKPSNFLKFKFTGFSPEAEHLAGYHNFRLHALRSADSPHSLSANAPASTPASDPHALREDLITQCKHLRSTGHSIRKIAKNLGIALTTVRKYISS